MTSIHPFLQSPCTNDSGTKSDNLAIIELLQVQVVQKGLFCRSGTNSSRGHRHCVCIAGETEEGADEEDCSVEFQPLVQLNEVETVSGEEAENVLVDL